MTGSTGMKKWKGRGTNSIPKAERKFSNRDKGESWEGGEKHGRDLRSKFSEIKRLNDYNQKKKMKGKNNFKKENNKLWEQNTGVLELIWNTREKYR